MFPNSPLAGSPVGFMKNIVFHYELHCILVHENQGEGTGKEGGRGK